MTFLRRPSAGPTRSPGRRPRVVITTIATVLALLFAGASAVAAAAGAAAPAGRARARPPASTVSQSTHAVLAEPDSVSVGSAPVTAPGAAGGTADGAPRGTWPVTPHVVVRGFSPPSSTYGAGHRGVDLAGTVGEAVHAALAGRVTYAGRLAGLGVVVINHGATRTTYEPIEASVQVGASVAAGDVIGHLELPGSHCLPDACLHWGWIAADGTYLDPLGLFGHSPVRLLPLQ